VRIWNVPCLELDDQRLLGEHREVHALLGMLRRGNFRGYAKRLAGDPDFLERRHIEQVVEMKWRMWSTGYNHLTPFVGFQASPSHPLVVVTQAMIDFDHSDLIERWNLRPHVWTRRNRPTWSL
jgi:hypothetical protein